MIQDKPSENLVLLTRYVVLVYGPTWLELKRDSRLQSGPLHLLHEVERQTKHLSGEALDTVRKYTQINGFFAHEEQTLLHLVCSEKLEEREVGVRHILRVRREQREAQTVVPQKKRRSKKVTKKIRKYNPQQINWKASSVETLVDLSIAETEPPLTMSLADEEVEMIIQEPLRISQYECISQFVERGVKDTTTAASSTTGIDRQDALTINMQTARKKVPQIRHKKYFNM